MHSRVQRSEISVTILAINFHMYFVIMYISVCYFLFFPAVFLYVYDSHFYRLFFFHTQTLYKYKFIVLATLCNILVRFTSDIPLQPSYYSSIGPLVPI
jgi:hypothetical protein